MKLVLHNLTYHDCPVAIREKVTFAAEQRHAMLRQMHQRDQIREAVILQTCNRLEFYLYVKKDFDSGAFLRDLLAAQGTDAAETWKKHSRELTGMDVVRHLFEVAAGLDSQMIGENQILAQVKAAYTESLETRMSRLIFHRLFHNAFRVGKAVRTRTQINCGAVSIGLAAVELAKEKVDLTPSRVMIVGAGENAELVAHYLSKAGVSGLVIANRDIEKARAMAGRFPRTEAVELSEIVSRLSDVDVVISSTASPEPILTRADVEWSLAGRERSLIIIDIAVPRDIDPEVGRIDCVRLYNIDDLDGQIAANRQRRNSEIPKAKAIVEEFVATFSQWYESLDLVPVISRLTQMGMELARAEARRYAGDFGDAGAEKLQAFAESLVKKVLHGPIRFIKDGGGEPSAEQLQAIDLVNKMFLERSQDVFKEVD
ncbi:MAG TPA: glutamyl-tRNA reductase [Sedimentisphaerales bacterium]|nr:glutamyl-tRNA reductase [Sedimentisphaerales bacterium]HOV77658.1 glutamyl-tRNA reductase [Sedimentisphaerales bacterium]HQI28200.1 glutamyl-tRNA reductase [Sedimentisphaerales bacterium]